MNPVLCQRGKKVEIDGRWFMAFIDCTIESIDDPIMVSDYKPIRDKAENLRENTCEVSEVTGIYHPRGSSKTEVEVLSQYTRCNPSDVSGKLAIAAAPNGLVVFVDKSYLPAIYWGADYGNIIRVHPDLTLADLKRLDLVDQKTVAKIHTETIQLSKLRCKMAKIHRLDTLCRAAKELGLTLTKEK